LKAIFQGVKKSCREKQFQKKKEKIIVDVNAIMLENRKKRTGTSLTTPNKMIKEISLLQEGDASEFIGETTIDASKPIVASNVVGKIIEVAIEENRI
jgi:hypothetical protein